MNLHEIYLRFCLKALEFFLFAGLMFVDMVIFMFLAYRYKAVVPVPEEERLIDSSTTLAEDEKKELTGLDNVAFTKDEQHKN